MSDERVRLVELPPEKQLTRDIIKSILSPNYDPAIR